MNSGVADMTDEQRAALTALYKIVYGQANILRGVLPGATSMMTPVGQPLEGSIRGILDAMERCNEIGIE